MMDYDAIIDRVANEQIVPGAAGAIEADVRQIIDSSEAFASPDPEIGAGLGEVVPLEASTVRIKLAGGFEAPSTARYRTGALYDSIRSEFGTLGGEVIAGMDYASEQQYGTPSRGITPAAARPFFGVSDRALKQVDAIVEKAGKDLETLLNRPDQLEPITVNVSA